MRFSLLLLFPILLLTGLAACNLDVEQVPDRYEYLILPDQSIVATPDTTYGGTTGTPDSWNYELEDGDTHVALYIFETQGEPTAIDDEVFLQFFFEFDPVPNSFILQDSVLWNARCMLDIDCYCPPIVYRIDSGKIIGTKLDEDSWHFDIDVQYFPNPADRTLSVPLQVSEDFHVIK